MGIKLNKEQTINVKQLVDTAAILDAEMKEIEKKLKIVKNQLVVYVEENFSNADKLRGMTIPGEKYIDVITGVEKRQDADPMEVLDALTAMKKEEKFIDLCKIQATGLTAMVGETLSKELRPVVEIQIRQSFKSLN